VAASVLRGMDQPQGEARFSIPRTLSWANRPLLLILVVLALGSAGFLWLMGEWKQGLFAAGAVVLVAAVVVVGQLSNEVLGGPRVDAVFENGVQWRAGSKRGFLPWADLVRIDRRERQTRNGVLTWWTVAVRANAAKELVLLASSQSEAAADFIAARVTR